MGEPIFPKLRAALSANDNKYFDEWSETTETLHRVVIVYSNHRLWLSTYEPADKIFRFRPLVVRQDGTVSLLDIYIPFSEKIERMERYGTSQNGRYEECYWYLFTREQFMNNTMNFTSSGNTYWFEKLERTFSKLTVGNSDVKECFEMRDQWTNTLTLIPPAQASDIVDDNNKCLYDQIMRSTSGESTWNIYSHHFFVDVKLCLVNGKLVYYVSRVHGDEGETWDGNKKKPYDIILENRELKVVQGTMESLVRVLDIVSKEKTYRPRLRLYEKRSAFQMTDYIHNWMMKGCPYIQELNYDLLSSMGGLSMCHLETQHLKIDLQGLSNSYLSIKDKTTKMERTFTDSHGYANARKQGSMYLVPVSEFYHDGEDRQSLYMTSDIRRGGLDLLAPIMQSLIHASN